MTFDWNSGIYIMTKGNLMLIYNILLFLSVQTESKEIMRLQCFYSLIEL